MMKKANKQKKIEPKDKFLLETSAQISRLTPSPKKAAVDQLSKAGYIYTSHFVLYEFKTGLIKNILDYYFLVKITPTPAEAMMIWVNKWGREVKNKGILDAKIAQLFGSIDTANTQRYLRQIRAVVFDLITNFETGIIGLIGEFGSDQIVKSDLFTEVDYKNFIDLYKTRKFISLQSFWKNHITELQKITSESAKMSATDGLKKIHKFLVEIKADLTKADKHDHSKGVGDAVIAVDMPSAMKLVSLDHSFATLCPLIDKKYIRIP